MSDSEFPPPTPDQAVGYGDPHESYRAEMSTGSAPAQRLGKIAWWFGVASIALGSVAVGIAGLVMGRRAMTQGNPRGKRAILLSTIGIVESIVLLVVFDITTH